MSYSIRGTIKRIKSQNPERGGTLNDKNNSNLEIVSNVFQLLLKYTYAYQ